MAIESASPDLATRVVNPYVRTLFVLLCATVALAVIFGLTALTLQRAEQDVGDTAVWSGAFWALSFATFLAWLVGSANAWKARA